MTAHDCGEESKRRVSQADDHNWVIGPSHCLTGRPFQTGHCTDQRRQGRENTNFDKNVPSLPIFAILSFFFYPHIRIFVLLSRNSR